MPGPGAVDELPPVIAAAFGSASTKPAAKQPAKQTRKTGKTTEVDKIKDFETTFDRVLKGPAALWPSPAEVGKHQTSWTRRGAGKSKITVQIDKKCIWIWSAADGTIPSHRCVGFAARTVEEAWAAVLATTGFENGADVD